MLLAKTLVGNRKLAANSLHLQHTLVSALLAVCIPSVGLCFGLPQAQPMGDSFRPFLSAWSCTSPGASNAASKATFRSLQSAYCNGSETQRKCHNREHSLDCVTSCRAQNPTVLLSTTSLSPHCSRRNKRTFDLNPTTFPNVLWSPHGNEG